MWSLSLEPGELWGLRLTWSSMPGLAAGATSTLVYFSCADCAVEAARAPKYGGRKSRRARPPSGPTAHYALLVDPAGNMIGLHSM